MTPFVFKSFQPLILDGILDHLPQHEIQDPDLDPRDAFMEAVAEYNAYGSAAMNGKWRIDELSASQMYGFKADLGFNVLVHELQLSSKAEER